MQHLSSTYILITIAPALAICWYVFHKDRYEKEPVWLVILAFCLGILSVFPAVIGSLIGGKLFSVSGNFINTGLYAFLVVALSEELAKFFFLRYVVFKRREFNEPYDGIVYAMMIGMGFAAFENVLYLSQDGIGVVLFRMITAIPAHAIFAVSMGYHVGLAKFDLTHRDELMGKGLIYPVLLHGTYDFLLMQQNIPALSAFAFIGLYFCIKNVRYILEQSNNQSPFKMP
ncbi:MAG: YpdC [Bacteroidota bacterium]|nr:YpdC [Bacteroidota bacterium]